MNARQIKEKWTCLDYLGERVVRKTSKGYLARCPWRDDNNPSLTITPDGKGWMASWGLSLCARRVAATNHPHQYRIGGGDSLPQHGRMVCGVSRGVWLLSLFAAGLDAGAVATGLLRLREVVRGVGLAAATLVVLGFRLLACFSVIGLALEVEVAIRGSAACRAAIGLTIVHADGFFIGFVIVSHCDAFPCALIFIIRRHYGGVACVR